MWHREGVVAVARKGSKPWLRNMAIDFCIWQLHPEYSLSDANRPMRKEHPGCHICLITLECGTQLISKHVKIRPDLESCDKIPAKRISASMPDPLAHLISTVPPIESLPYFESRTDIGISMMRQIKAKLIETPQLKGIWTKSIHQ